MVVGILQFELIIRGSRSLKDKRRVVRSVKDRLHREHMVAVAEVGAHDMLNLAIMGLACVGTDGGHVGQMLDRITVRLRALEGVHVGECVRQVLHGSQLVPATGEDMDERALAEELLRHYREASEP